LLRRRAWHEKDENFLVFTVRKVVNSYRRDAKITHIRSAMPMKSLVQILQESFP